MQHRLEGDVRFTRQRVSQRERAVGGQFRHQPVGQRADGVVLVRRLRLGSGRSADGDDGALDRRRRFGRDVAVRRAVAASGRLNRRFILGPDEATIDAQGAFAVDADEDAGAGDLRGIVADRAILEGSHGRLDLAEPLVDLVGQLVGLGVLLLEGLLFGLERGEARLLLLGEGDGVAGQPTQAGGVAIGKVGRDRDPLPALGAQALGLGLELLDHEPIEQRRVLQPAAIVMLEQVAQDRATGGLIGVEPDELGATVGGADRALGELAPDMVGLLVVGVADALPNLFLAGMVAGDRERHELLQRHAVLGIDVEERRRDGGEAQPLLHHGRRHEEAGGDLLLAEALVAQGLEGAELVEGMKGDALDILGQRILLSDPALAHDAGHRRGLGQALLLDQQFERPESAAAGGHLEHAGLLAVRVEHGSDAEALQQGAVSDVLGQLLDRDTGLHAPDVGLAEHQLVEGDVTRGAEDDLLNSGSHVGNLRDGRRETLSRLPTRHGNRRSPLTLRFRRSGKPEKRKHGCPASRFG